MQTKFNCTHCEKCCCEIAVPVNISIFDLVRLSKSKNTPISSLFPKHFAFWPFLEQEDTFSFQLGLNSPCIYYHHEKEKDKCMIHPFRPLNCRIFPYWILVHFHHLKICDNTTDCLANLKLDEHEVKKYREYSKKLGDIIEKERETTNNILKELGAVKQINLKDNPKFLELKIKNLDKKEFARQEIKLCMSLIDQDDYKEVINRLEQKITKKIRKQAMENLEKTKELEKILNR